MYHSMLRTRRALVIAAAAGVLSLAAARAASAAVTATGCQTAINAAAQKYEAARAGILAKCEEAKVKGKFASSIVCGAAAPTGDQKTYDKIAKADAKRTASIDKACSGLALSAINWDGRVPACNLGERDGLDCQTNADCPAVCNAGQRAGLGVECPTEGVANSNCPSICDGTCAGGSNAGARCTQASDCPGSTCGSMTCKGGTRDTLTCTQTADVPVGTGCPGNNTCTKSLGCGTAGKVVSECPDLENKGCKNALSTIASIDTCVKCTGEAGVAQVVDNFYASLSPLSPLKDLEKCKAAIGKNGTKYFSAASKALAGCQKGALKNALPNTCPDVKATDKINAARTKLVNSIATACGGANKAFGGSGPDQDLTPDAIGAPLTCPNVDPPGSIASCYKFLSTAQDVANCAACLDDYKALTLDAITVTADDPLPPETNTLCGNAKIDTGESCDDGNLVDGDACPGNCVISACTPTGTATVTVSFNALTGSDVTGLTVYLEYPDSAIQVPGQGSNAAVQNAIVTLPANNLTYTPNDYDYAIRTVFTDGDSPQVPITPGALFDLTVTRCNGAALPVPGDFGCRVESASAAGGVTVFGATCSVTAVTP